MPFPFIPIALAFMQMAQSSQPQAPLPATTGFDLKSDIQKTKKAGKTGFLTRAGREIGGALIEQAFAPPAAVPYSPPPPRMSASRTMPQTSGAGSYPVYQQGSLMQDPILQAYWRR